MRSVVKFLWEASLFVLETIGHIAWVIILVVIWPLGLAVLLHWFIKTAVRSGIEEANAGQGGRPMGTIERSSSELAPASDI